MARLVLVAIAALLLVPSGQAWVINSYGLPVRADVQVDGDAEPQEEDSATATILVCSGPDEWRLDVEEEPGWVTVWVPLGPDESQGSHRTTAGCGSAEDASPVRITLWVDPLWQGERPVAVI